MPFVDHELEVFQVAFGVVGQVTGRGLEGAGVDGLGHLFGVFGLGGLDALGDQLDSRVGREHERAAWVLAVSLDGVDDLLVRRVRVERLRQGHQQAFGGVLGDLRDGVVTHAFRAHELGFQAFFLSLAQDQAQLWVVAAVVDEVDVVLLELLDDRGEVLVTGVQAFEDGNLGAFAFQCLLDGGGDAFTVLLLVVQDGNDLRLDVVGDVVAGSRALGAVQADGAEDQLVATGGDFRRGGGRGDHDHAFVFVDVGRRLGGAGAQVADDELDAVVDHFVGDCNGLFRVAGVVVFLGFEHLAIDAALGVDILDGLLGADELHVAVLGHRAGFRACNPDLDGIGGKRMAGYPCQNHCGEQLGNLDHSAPLILL
ncbi:hypothetical protein D3C76_507710 [compost metagenome]